MFSVAFDHYKMPATMDFLLKWNEVYWGEIGEHWDYFIDEKQSSYSPLTFTVYSQRAVFQFDTQRKAEIFEKNFGSRHPIMPYSVYEVFVNPAQRARLNNRWLAKKWHPQSVMLACVDGEYLDKISVKAFDRVLNVVFLSTEEDAYYLKMLHG
jgi:hypothetical protein